VGQIGHSNTSLSIKGKMLDVHKKYTINLNLKKIKNPKNTLVDL
jgi:hypothetical protein